MLKVAVISTVRTPLQDLLMFTNYHLNIGIDEMILFFDDPLDAGIDSFSQHENITAIACSAEHWSKTEGERPDSIEKRQVANVNRGAEIAKNKNCNWVVHIDSDELIDPRVGLKEVLANCDAQTLRFSMLEAASEREDYDNIFETTLFKKKPHKAQIFAAKLLGCSDAIFDGEYFRGHKSSKRAIKLSPKIRRIGIHGPSDYDKSIINKRTSKIRLLHYDCVGFDDWNSKWGRRLDGSGRATDMRTNRDKQFQEYIQARDKGDEELRRTYRRLQVIPKRERPILFLLGMLKTVTLDKALFSSQ